MVIYTISSAYSSNVITTAGKYREITAGVIIYERGGRYINIVIHNPKTAEGYKELEKRTASTYAQAVTQYIERLSCPKEQKLRLYAELEKAYRKRVF